MALVASINEAIVALDHLLMQLDRPRAVHKSHTQKLHNAKTTATLRDAAAPSANTPATGAPAAQKDGPAAQPTKKVKAKDPAPALAAAAPAGDAFDKALLKVVRLVSVEPLLNSDKLYKCQVDCGNGEARQICAGLRLYIPAEELCGSLVVALLNLKAAKLAGEVSDGMVLAGVHRDASCKEVAVCTLIPPAGSKPGDTVYRLGREPNLTAAAKVLKGDDWRKIKAQLGVVGGYASFQGCTLVTAAGPITLPSSIPDGSSID